MTWRDAAMLACGVVLGCGLLWGVLAWEAGTAPFFPKAQAGPCMCVRSQGICTCLVDILTAPAPDGKKAP